MKDYIQEMERLAQVQEAYKAMDSLLAQKQCPSKTQEQIARRKRQAYQARLHYLVDAYPFSVVINRLRYLERLAMATAWVKAIEEDWPHLFKMSQHHKITKDGAWEAEDIRKAAQAEILAALEAFGAS